MVLHLPVEQESMDWKSTDSSFKKKFLAQQLVKKVIWFFKGSITIDFIEKKV